MIIYSTIVEKAKWGGVRVDLNSKQLVRKVVGALEDKKAQDIEVLNIQKVSLLSDYFVICTGRANTQIKSLADNVEDVLAKAGYAPRHKEGYSSASWILLDYGEVVVHIFHHESRSFYNLERLWSDSIPVDINVHAT